jgi:H+/Cl- antiporter ClcA
LLRLPSPQELAIYVLLAIVLALLGLLIWKQLIRNSTSLSRRLKAYAAYRAKDDKRKTKAWRA